MSKPDRVHHKNDVLITLQYRKFYAARESCRRALVCLMTYEPSLPSEFFNKQIRRSCGWDEEGFWLRSRRGTVDARVGGVGGGWGMGSWEGDGRMGEGEALSTL